MPAQPEIRYSVCPHDCPSTCALAVERLDADTIGRVRGARDNTYTAGVICSKVARYAERIHHPDRLTTPLRRVGEKGRRESFEPISFDDALDITAEALLEAEARHGPETVWPYYYAGTMGLLMRTASTACATPSATRASTRRSASRLPGAASSRARASSRAPIPGRWRSRTWS